MTEVKPEHAAFMAEESESASPTIAAVSTGTSNIGTTAIAGLASSTATSVTQSARERAPRARTPGLAEWLDSPDALSYRGRWVLLSDSYAPLAAADGPSPLLEAHEGSGAPLIVYVSPTDS